MWNDRKPWWSKKAESNQSSKNHYKNWCVIRVATGYEANPSRSAYVFTFEYKAVAKDNAPKTFNARHELVTEVEVDNLTKHEAHCVAKGLNFLDKE